jgi:hypothetical protein
MILDEQRTLLCRKGGERVKYAGTNRRLQEIVGTDSD